MKRSDTGTEEKKQKPEKFNFEKMKNGALHKDASVRKQTFVEYFERFAEFPSFLFETEAFVDERLLGVIEDIRNDPATSKMLRVGIEALAARLTH